LYIKTDGGPETLLRENTGGQPATTWTQAGITGSTLQVIIRTSVTAADESYFFDNLSITSTGLPSPWQTLDVGAVAATGSVSYASRSWTVVGSGADVLGAADEFRYIHQSASGDCSIVAHVSSLQNTNAWAKAGVMIRESTAANSANVFVFVTPTNGVAFTLRSTTGGSTDNSTVAVAGQTAPKWLKLTRTGNSFTAYRSDNGTTWTQVGTAPSINMAVSTTVGLAVCSHADGTLCTSTIDSVIATP
jgi:regulation of enolase protein 1 (concanavalin A-like superfamily)